MSKNALVVGSSGGIGSSITRVLVRDGFKVWGTYFQDKSSCEKLSKELPSGTFIPFAMNCSDDSSIAQGMAQVLSASQYLDVVVFSVTPPIVHGSALKNDWSVYRNLFEIQVKGFLLIMRSLESQFRTSHKTKIIVILSEYTVGKPASGVSDYVAAKYALLGLSKSFAVELPRYNSTVNMVSPGMTETELLLDLPQKAIEFTALNNPLKRIAKPNDVAGVVSFLASEKSDYLNGVNILVNGGGVMT